MKKLNILIVCDAITRQLGGAFISPLRFAKALKERGHKVIFISALYPGTTKEDFHEDMKIYRFMSISMPKYRNLIRLGFPSKKEIDSIIKKEKIDIVHLMVPTPASITAIKVAKENNIRTVSHSHTQPENIIAHLPKLIRWNLIGKLYCKYILSIYKKTDVHICPSEFAEKALKKYKIKFKTVVISNGVDLKKFKKIDSSPFFKKYNLQKKNKLILYVGRLDPEKCVDVLIKSTKFILERNKDVIVGIVGGGGLRKKLEELSIEKGLEKNVKFLGKISDKDLVRAYNASDIFVLPSLVELEGMVVLEAMACGKPLIIANSPTSASVSLVNENGLLFEPGNPEDLAEKINQLLDNTTLREKMGKKSFELSKKYDIEKSIDKLEGIYYSLMT